MQATSCPMLQKFENRRISNTRTGPYSQITPSRSIWAIHVMSHLIDGRD